MRTANFIRQTIFGLIVILIMGFLAVQYGGSWNTAGWGLFLVALLVIALAVMAPSLCLQFLKDLPAIASAFGTKLSALWKKDTGPEAPPTDPPAENKP